LGIGEPFGPEQFGLELTAERLKAEGLALSSELRQILAS
jgi:hypothetical protein